jgi:hypothetical protein
MRAYNDEFEPERPRATVTSRTTEAPLSEPAPQSLLTVQRAVGAVAGPQVEQRPGESTELGGLPESTDLATATPAPENLDRAPDPKKAVKKPKRTRQLEAKQEEWRREGKTDQEIHELTQRLDRPSKSQILNLPRPKFEKLSVSDVLGDLPPETYIHLTVADSTLEQLRPGSYWFEFKEVSNNTVRVLQESGIRKEAQGYTSSRTVNSAKGFVYILPQDSEWSGVGLNNAETNPVGKEYQHSNVVKVRHYKQLPM